MAQRILIVDDNEKNLKLARVLLQSAGYATAEAEDGACALRICREQAFDLILLDIQMPLMNGIEVLRALRAEPGTSRVPVIALTSYAMKGDRERFLGDGFVDYIAKPIERVGFLATIADILKRGGGPGAGAGPQGPPPPRSTSGRTPDPEREDDRIA